MPKKSKKVSRSKPKKARVNPVPKGFTTVTPYLVVEGAAEALEWYKKAFSAKEQSRQTVPGGKIMHARIKIGDSIVMLADVFPGGNSKDPKSLGSTPVTLHIYAKNADKLWQQAVDAGATVNMPLSAQFWGEMYGQLKDPFGHNWSISMVIPMSKKEMKEKQEQAMAMFSQGEHPGASQEQPMIAQQ